MADRTSVNHYESLRATDYQDSSGAEGTTTTATLVPMNGVQTFRFMQMRIVITVREALGSDEGCLIYLGSQYSTVPFAAVGILEDSAPAGTMIEATLDLGEGYLSSSPDYNVVLFLTGDEMTSGVLNVFSEFRGVVT
jgi:hypothetical protein